jgi:hypothetical protein
MIGAITAGLFSTGAAAGGGTAYESIATVTAGVGGASSLSFSSIPSTYKHLQLRWIGRTLNVGATDYINIAFNGDTTSSTSYWYHWLRGTGSAADATSSGAFYAFRLAEVSGATATASAFGCGVFDILDYANTSKNKTARSLGGFDSNGNGRSMLVSGLYTNTSAISSIQLTGANGNIDQYSSFALYGIKG